MCAPVSSKTASYVASPEETKQGNPYVRKAMKTASWTTIILTLSCLFLNNPINAIRHLLGYGEKKKGMGENQK